jgi:MFS family permease
LIQVHSFPATFAGAAFLPPTVLIAVLSRWAGGLVDRLGARLPLTIGPGIAAFGIALLGILVPNGSYWQFIVSLTILGFGMVVTVAPLTTTVIDAVPAHQTGVASGINNAAASIADLFAVAILGALAILILDHTLSQHLQSQVLSDSAKHAIHAAHGQLVIEPTLTNLRGADRAIVEPILRESLAKSIRAALVIAAAFAAGAAVVATVIPRSTVHIDDS